MHWTWRALYAHQNRPPPDANTAISNSDQPRNVDTHHCSHTQTRSKSPILNARQFRERCQVQMESSMNRSPFHLKWNKHPFRLCTALRPVSYSGQPVCRNGRICFFSSRTYVERAAAGRADLQHRRMRQTRLPHTGYLWVSYRNEQAYGQMYCISTDHLILQ